jgi:hypothetical protein
MYEPHVKILFENMGGLISFLSKTRPVKTGTTPTSSSSDTEGDENDNTDPKEGYYAIKNDLLDKIYLRFFSAERYEDTLLNDLRDKVIE